MKTTICALFFLALLLLAAPGQDPAAPAPESSVAAPELAAPAPEPALAPKIVCAAPAFDFGEKSNTEIVEHDYPIRNAGTLSLEIRDVHASCGCTVVKPSQNLVPPGGEASIHARLDLRGRSGLQMKTITVTSNDPETPTLSLQLKGTAVQALRTQPPSLFLGRLEPGAPRSRTFDIISARGPIQITNLRADHPGVALRPVELEPGGDGSTRRFEMTLSPDLPEGAINGSVFILTDMAGQAELSVPFAAFIVNPLPAPAVEATSAAEPPPVPAP